MLSGWGAFRGWSVLEYFLRSPSAETHVKGLARALRVSPLTAHTYLKLYLRDGVLEAERKGNAVFYRLAGTPFTKALKRCYALSVLSGKRFVEKVLEENPSATSVVLYGTMASGEYDEKSDWDLLVFSKLGAFPRKAAALLEGKANVCVLSVQEWRKLDAGFRRSVSRNHVVLCGSELVE